MLNPLCIKKHKGNNVKQFLMLQYNNAENSQWFQDVYWHCIIPLWLWIDFRLRRHRNTFLKQVDSFACWRWFRKPYFAFTYKFKNARNKTDKNFFFFQIELCNNVLSRSEFLASCFHSPGLRKQLFLSHASFRHSPHSAKTAQTATRLSYISFQSKQRSGWTSFFLDVTPFYKKKKT